MPSLLNIGGNTKTPAGLMKKHLEVLHTEGCSDYHVFQNANLDANQNGSPEFIAQAGLRKWAVDQMRIEAATQIHTALYCAARLEPHDGADVIFRRLFLVAFPRFTSEKALPDDKELKRWITAIWPYPFPKKKAQAPAFKIGRLPTKEAEQATGMLAGCISPFGLRDSNLAPDIRLIHEETVSSLQAVLFVRPQSHHHPRTGVLLGQGQYLVLPTEKYDGLLGAFRKSPIPGVHVVEKQEQSSTPPLVELFVHDQKASTKEPGIHVINP